MLKSVLVKATSPSTQSASSWAAMLRMRNFLIAAIPLALCACSYDEIAASLIPEEESEFARDYLQRLRDGDIDYIKFYLDAELIGQVTDEGLIEISNYFPTGELLSEEIIGSQVNVFDSEWSGNFTFEYQFSDGWAVANTALRRVNDTTTVIGLNVYRTPASQRELNSFGGVELTAFRIAVLAITIASPIFMIVTCYFVYRTPIPRRKWLWFLLSFVGVGGFSFNWTSSELAYQLVSVQLLGAGAFAAGPAAPWVLSFTLPVGAAAFWVLRRRLSQSSAPST